MTSEQTKIIKSTSDADMLSLVPHLMGIQPTESVVVMPFHRKRSMGGIRMDLPQEPADKDMDAMAACFVSNLSRLNLCTSAMIVVYTGLDYREARSRYKDLMHRLESRFIQAGFGIYRSFLQAGTGWGEIDEEEPVGGRPLTELEACSQGHVGELDPVTELDGDFDARIPEADEDRSRRVAKTLEHLYVGEEVTGLGVVIPAREVDEVNLVEELLTVAPEEIGVLDLSRFILAADVPSTRDQMLVQLGFGRAAGAQGRRGNRIHAARMRRTGLTSDELAEKDMAAGRGLQQGVSMITGTWPHPPDPERIRAARDLVAFATAHAPKQFRAPLLCILGWLAWASGKSTVAGKLLDQAVRLDPLLRMGRLLQMLVTSGRIPDWGYAYVDRVTAQHARDLPPAEEAA